MKTFEYLNLLPFVITPLRNMFFSNALNRVFQSDTFDNYSIDIKTIL